MIAPPTVTDCRRCGEPSVLWTDIDAVRHRAADVLRAEDAMSAPPARFLLGAVLRLARAIWDIESRRR